MKPSPPRSSTSAKLIAPKAQFQLVAGCDVVDFGCPLTMSGGVCLSCTVVSRAKESRDRRGRSC